RRPYTGSCHCGQTRYLLFLTLPPSILPPTFPTSRTHTVRIRKCNCSTCHKTGFFHVRVPWAPSDFLVLSPLKDRGQFGGLDVAEMTGKGEGVLGDYTCFEGNLHWLFCHTCGVRCFLWAGEGEVVDVRDASVDTETIERLGIEGTKVWRPKEEQKDGVWAEGTGRCYVSVNAHTLDQGQEGVDLRRWVDDGWVCYVDSLEDEGEERVGKPHVWGTY
ncbi:hypothetical protein M501DRAFT_924111, partial [Patellaria atrata CBS 101060]